MIIIVHIVHSFRPSLTSKCEIFSGNFFLLQGLMHQEQTDYLFAHTKVYVG